MNYAVLDVEYRYTALDLSWLTAEIKMISLGFNDWDIDSSCNVKLM